jgi:hypothetical protein
MSSDVANDAFLKSYILVLVRGVGNDTKSVKVISIAKKKKRAGLPAVALD